MITGKSLPSTSGGESLASGGATKKSNQASLMHHNTFPSPAREAFLLLFSYVLLILHCGYFNDICEGLHIIYNVSVIVITPVVIVKLVLRQ